MAARVFPGSLFFFFSGTSGLFGIFSDNFRAFGLDGASGLSGASGVSGLFGLSGLSGVSAAFCYVSSALKPAPRFVLQTSVDPVISMSGGIPNAIVRRPFAASEVASRRCEVRRQGCQGGLTQRRRQTPHRVLTQMIKKSLVD